jgi:hypothetical protein
MNDIKWTHPPLVLHYACNFIDSTKLPCRIVCSVEGLEGFIYNNVFFYQRIKDILGLETDNSTTQRSMDSYGMNG